MTDKKKIDEAVSLSMNSTENGIVSNTIFSADDLTSLAAMLKAAGIAGNSNEFEGPAVLNIDDRDSENPNNSVSTSIQAPNLRSIMNLLEPEFEELGHQEEMGMELESEISEDCGYDYREHDVHPKEYPGKGSKEIVQPDTKLVPARSGDNPLKTSEELDEAEESFKSYLSKVLEAKVRAMSEDSAQADSMKNDILRFANSIGMGNDGANYLNQSLEMASPEALDNAHRYVARQYWPSCNGDDIAMVNNMLRRQTTIESLMLEFKKHQTVKSPVVEISSDLKQRYIDKALADKEAHERRAGELDDLGYDADRAEKMGVMRPGAGDRVRQWVKAHDRKAYRREKTLDKLGILRAEESQDISEKMDWKTKIRQYGEPYYLNTDMGYASLESIMKGQEYFETIPTGLERRSNRYGFTVLEIDRNGKKGFNYVNSPDYDLEPNTPVTCITQTSTGDKFRPGKFIMSISAKELADDYQGVVDRLAKIGISPTKKLPVKSFD